MTINCLAESRSRYDLSRSRPEKDRLRNTATEVLCTYSDLVKPLSPPHAKATPTDQGSIFYTMMGGGGRENEDLRAKNCHTVLFTRSLSDVKYRPQVQKKIKQKIGKIS